MTRSPLVSLITSVEGHELTQYHLFIKQLQVFTSAKHTIIFPNWVQKSETTLKISNTIT